MVSSILTILATSHDIFYRYDMPRYIVALAILVSTISIEVSRVSHNTILEGLQQKLEGLEPLSPIAGAATDNTPDYVENTLISTTHWTIQFHGAVCWLQPESSIVRCCKLAN